MELQCPNCGSKDLKGVSLVYQEGLSRIQAKSRLKGLSLGDNGVNVIVGTAATSGIQWTELFKLRPPIKWSYARLSLSTGLMAITALVVYVHKVMAGSAVSSAPIVIVGGLGLMTFLVLLFVVWRHNQVGYPRQLAEWQRSFVCHRCGAIS